MTENITPWEIRGYEMTNCNCDYGCPCQFEGQPTHGNCHAFYMVKINTGHFGDDVTLDGLLLGFVAKWPGPIYEGQGEMAIYIDARADDAQFAALSKIATGQSTMEMATPFAVFYAMCDTHHGPERRDMTLTFDTPARTAHGVVDGVGEFTMEPIISPATGEPHAARILLPKGFGYEVAEMASSTARTTGPVSVAFEKTYAQMNVFNQSHEGILRDAEGLPTAVR